MLKIIQKLAPAPPTGLYSHVAPLTEHYAWSWGSLVYRNVTVYVYL